MRSSAFGWVLQAVAAKGKTRLNKNDALAMDMAILLCRTCERRRRRLVPPMECVPFTASSPGQWTTRLRIGGNPGQGGGRSSVAFVSFIAFVI